MNMPRVAFCGFFCFLFAGCVHLGNMNMSNPFTASQADVNDVYYSSFPDIPIPADMSVDRKYTLVSVGPDGEKMGFLVFSGRVERESLCAAMIHNMPRNGWILRGVVDGKRTIQLYKKQNRYAILYIYGGGLITTVESWVVAKLDNGSYQPSVSEKPYAPPPCPTPEAEPSSYLTTDQYGEGMENVGLEELDLSD